MALTKITVANLFGASATADASGVKIAWTDIEAVMGMPSGYTKASTASSGADLLRAILMLVAYNVSQNGASSDNDVNVRMRSNGIVKSLYSGSENSNKERFEVQIISHLGGQQIAS